MPCPFFPRCRTRAATDRKGNAERGEAVPPLPARLKARSSADKKADRFAAPCKADEGVPLFLHPGAALERAEYVPEERYARQLHS
jgi:hypothetical protein